MAKRINKTILFENKPTIISYASVVGKKERQGPLAKEFDYVYNDDTFGQKSFEDAESQIQRLSILAAMKKRGIKPQQIDCVFAGDLLNQCIGSSFGLKDLDIPFVGMYGACSTMALSLLNASVHIESGAANTAIAVTSSHFCSAERQYRFPLEYGSQRPPTSQWTVTGGGAVILHNKNDGTMPYINAATVGTIQDLGIKDANNMGAAMAPDDVKIRPYPRHEGMVFFYTQIQYLRGFRALFKNFLTQKIVEKSVNGIRNSSSIH